MQNNIFEVQRLEWDSEFFGYEVGKIVINNKKDFFLKNWQSKIKEFKLVYVFSEEFINLDGFKLVDRKATLSQKIDKNCHFENTLIESFDINFHDYGALKKLALESGIYSRFFIDENFVNNEYFNLYSKWIDNSVLDKKSFEILIAINSNRIVGFTTINKKNDQLADIGLVAVAKESRGLGIGKNLINESILRCKNAGFDSIQVITQFDNVTAMNLYKATNFEIVDLTYIYHLWNI